MLNPRRPRSILGLLLKLFAVNWLLRRALGCLLTFLFLALLVVFLLVRGCSLHGPIRVATFNIENFPQSEEQIRGAFDAIVELEAEVVAVQEILEPETFQRAARQRLGSSWRFVTTKSGPRQRQGVLFDGDRWELIEIRDRDETTLGGRHKPTLEVLLESVESRQGSRRLRFFVVHLKAASDGVETRRQQLAALESILDGSDHAGEHVVVLGDFNATENADRAAISALADETGLFWATESVECTAYWDRSDGCLGSALDHVLVNRPALNVTARGPCESEGCQLRDRCPIFHRDVSDHCPLVADVL